MTWLEWLCLLGMAVGITILFWVGWGDPQAPDATTRQLNRIEERLDQLLHEAEEPPPSPPARRPSPPARRPPPRREPSLFVPVGPLPELPRIDALEVPPEPPPRACCHRDWAAIDAARQERTLVGGD